VRQYLKEPVFDGQVFLPIDAFSRRFGVGRTKAYALINAGAIEAVKLDRRTLVVLASALRWAASLPQYARKPSHDGGDND